MDLEKEELLEEALEEIVEGYGLWTKEECKYLEQSPEELVAQGLQCSTCYFFNEGSCGAVEGPVAESGYCRFWVTRQVEKEEEEEKGEEEYSLTSQEDFLVSKELSSVLLSENSESLFTPLDSMRGVARKLSLSQAKSPLLSDIILGNKLSLLQVQEAATLPSSIFKSWSSKITNSLNNMTARQKKKTETAENLEPLSSVELLSNGLVKIPVAKVGEWKHPQYGKVKFSDSDFDQIISNFEDKALGFPPYATYGHLVDQEVESIDAELKKGDAVGFEREGDVLFVLTEPKPDTLELIKRGEYEYSSGEFIRGYKDKNTGEDRGTVLIRYALTNAPFLPFDEQKIELLSNNSKDDNGLQTPSTFVIKLTGSSGDSSATRVITELNTMQDNTTSATPEVSSTQEVVEVVEANKTDKPLEIKVENPGAVTSVTAATTAPIESVPAAAASGFDVNKLLEQINSMYQSQMTGLKSQYEAQIGELKSQSENVVASLKSEVDSLKGRLDSQVAVTQAFSNSMTAQQKQARYGEMVSKGVPPTMVQKFSEIESALDTGSKVIKLSTAAGESEFSLADSIRDLLIEALSSEPVQFEQLGQTVSLASANGLVAELSAIVTKNKELAKKA